MIWLCGIKTKHSIQVSNLIFCLPFRIFKFATFYRNQKEMNYVNFKFLCLFKRSETSKSPGVVTRRWKINKRKKNENIFVKYAHIIFKRVNTFTFIVVSYLAKAPLPFKKSATCTCNILHVITPWLHVGLIYSYRWECVPRPCRQDVFWLMTIDDHPSGIYFKKCPWGITLGHKRNAYRSRIFGLVWTGTGLVR